MKSNSYAHQPILLIGEGKLTCGIAACLLEAGHPVIYITEDIDQVSAQIGFYITAPEVLSKLALTTQFSSSSELRIAIAVTEENPETKQALISKLETNIPHLEIIAINSESIDLEILQQETIRPERIIGLNWTEPAQNTLFLEIITNKAVSAKLAEELRLLAKHHWKKDPYVLTTGYSIRARLMAAMVREAFFLVENGYVTFEDVDRACRNDAGYYLPFAGNFRYMDLMGTYIYGLVMKDMNPELAGGSTLPAFFESLISQGNLGMESNQGFFSYTSDEVEHWNKTSLRFSEDIRMVMDKYP